LLKNEIDGRKKEKVDQAENNCEHSYRNQNKLGIRLYLVATWPHNLSEFGMAVFNKRDNLLHSDPFSAMQPATSRQATIERQ